jgi:PatG C-terminal/Subtilase family/PatG Domain
MGVIVDAHALTALQELRDVTFGEPDVCVAVLDGPVDLTHPCFSGANIKRIDTLVRDPAGNGPMSVHGTHVASVIFGQPGSPVPGVAPRCRGLVVPVFRDSGTRSLSQLDLTRAIEQAVQEGAHVVNISGGQRAPEGQAEGMLERALKLCEDSNVLVIAAVGNDGCPCLQVPAAVPSVLGVGALGTDGTPLPESNWGAAYRANGILAPGEAISGASPGGGTVALTGSSFAAPFVSGIAALLLSAQLARGRKPDPREVRKILLETALPCQQQDTADCQRYLAGILNVPGAYASITKGGMTMATENTAEAAQPIAGSPDAAALQPSAETATGAVAVGPDAVPGGLPSALAQVSPSGVAAAGDCGCGGAKKSYIFAIGTIGFDFGTEARRDSFRQLMPRPERGDPPVSVPPNPYDVVQLIDYLDANKSESTKLTWTLNLDLTPIYALEAELAYAEDVYEHLRSALRNQARPTSDENYVSRVSIPGVLTSRTKRLFSGQVVPVVTAQPRGLYTWNETALVDVILQGVLAGDPNAPQQQIRLTLRNFLDKVYYQLRNLGQNPSDRALNFAATNAFIFAEGIQQGLLSAQNLPGGNNLYTLDTISVAKSPYCRMDSDCWDVSVTFFDPENDRRARAVYQYTIDVSDEMPVSLAPTHQFFVAS